MWRYRTKRKVMYSEENDKGTHRPQTPSTKSMRGHKSQWQIITSYNTHFTKSKSLIEVEVCYLVIRHLLMVFMLPKGPDCPCFPPSATDVVLALPLIVYFTNVVVYPPLCPHKLVDTLGQILWTPIPKWVTSRIWSKGHRNSQSAVKFTRLLLS